MSELALESRFKGCFLGLALGDAVGCTVEFRSRDKFEPLTDMVGGGKFELEKGQWTDDTSMALCLAHSLLECGGFDASDQMNRYIRWFDEGYMSCKPKGFGIGKQTARAIGRYMKSKDPFAGSTHPEQAGNGALMRIAPVPMFYFPDIDTSIKMAIDSSRTTHACDEVVETSELFVRMLFKAFNNESKANILNTEIHSHSDGIKAICNQSYLTKTENEIVGSGYVVECLEAALWCFATTDDFESAILKAVNLGDDADTTAAICGQLAGAFYGYEGLPTHWLEYLAHKPLIEDVAIKLFKGH
jgi:ADP-ribosyl-[dinitrogen reductase] hydrolase